MPREKGFGLTRMRVSAQGIHITVLAGLVGSYWFPISDVSRVELVPPSLNSGMVSSLRWSVKTAPTMTFTPWFGNVADVSRVLPNFVRSSETTR